MMDTQHEENGRSAAAARMKLSRQRRKDGLRCVTVELRNAEIEALVRQGLLNGVARNDQKAVIDALYRHLDRTLG